MVTHAQHTRTPAVAGQFYPSDPKELSETVEKLLPKKASAVPRKAVIVPHAGYIYSGKIAGNVYARTAVPSLSILVGPNHTGRGASLSLYPGGSWMTPLGAMRVNQDFVQAIRREFDAFSLDTLAHTYEHSLEVQLPFLKHISAQSTIVPIIVGTDHVPSLLKAGSALGRVIRDWKQPSLLICSTDMTHYEPLVTAQRKDKMAIQALTSLDPKELALVVAENAISMCGWAPAVMILAACRTLGATKAEFIAYGTSADTTGDRSSVVGYAGMAFG
ncbi:MAG: AmmeMemoRadiSam system protein B [Candidatus Omnitrophica bacterium]|nr:AmmeMemoRadiSam system protein B [Candidatus Omnitrophota bacterium]